MKFKMSIFRIFFLKMAVGLFFGLMGSISLYATFLPVFGA